MAAIKALCREFQQCYSHVRIEKEIDITEDTIFESLKMMIYRISQEALNNIAKHSKASFVDFALRKAGRNIELAIRDNGQGFDVEKKLSVKTSRGLGLVSMRERAEFSGGSLTVESAKGRGTVIRASWPIEKSSP